MDRIEHARTGVRSNRRVAGLISPGSLALLAARNEVGPRRFMACNGLALPLQMRALPTWLCRARVRKRHPKIPHNA